jgi:hypothetical protein
MIDEAVTKALRVLTYAGSDEEIRACTVEARI